MSRFQQAHLTNLRQAQQGSLMITITPRQGDVLVNVLVREIDEDHRVILIEGEGGESLELSLGDIVGVKSEEFSVEPIDSGVSADNVDFLTENRDNVIGLVLHDGSEFPFVHDLSIDLEYNLVTFSSRGSQDRISRMISEIKEVHLRRVF